VATESLIVELDAQTSKLDAKLNSTSDNLDDVAVSAGRLDNALGGVSNAGFKVAKTASAVNSGLSGIGRSAGQAGIQIQQFVGQIQGGQSAMLALSQQGADLGFVLGAPLIGAIVGIGASAIGMATGLGTAKSAMDQLSESAVKLEEVLDSASDGSKKLSERLLEIATRSESLARIQIAQSILDIEESTKVAIKGIDEAIIDSAAGFTNYGDELRGVVSRVGGSLDTLRDSTKSFRDIVDDDSGLQAGDPLLLSALEGQTKRLQDEFGITRSQAIDLGLALSDLVNNEDILSARGLERVISDISETVDTSDEKFIKFAATLSPFFNSISDGIDNTNLLRQAFQDLNGAIEQQAETGSLEGSNFSNLFDIGQTQADPELFASVFDERLEIERSYIERVNELRLAEGLTLEERLANEVEINRLALEQKLIDEEDFRNRQAELTERYSADQIKQAQARTKAEQSIERNNASTLLNIAQSLASGNDEISKALFLTSQALSASEVFFNTQAAAVRALAELGPIAGPPVAAQIETSGAIRIAAIAAQTFGSLAGGSSSSGGTISANTATNATETASDFTPETSTLELTEQSDTGSQVITINVPDGDEIGEAIANWLNKATIEGRV